MFDILLVRTHAGGSRSRGPGMVSYPAQAPLALSPIFFHTRVSSPARSDTARHAKRGRSFRSSPTTGGGRHRPPATVFRAQAPPQTNRPLTQLNSTGTWFAPVSFFIARSASRPYLLGSLQRAWYRPGRVSGRPRAARRP